MKKIYIFSLLFGLLLSFKAYSQDSQSIEEVSKKLSNPLSDLWYLIMENHYSTIENKVTGEKYNGNFFMFQPVLPVTIANDKIIVANRPTFGFLSVDQKSGLGLSTQDRYKTKMTDFRWLTLFAPNKSQGFIYGAGPMLTAPTSSSLVYNAPNFQFGYGLAALYLHKRVTVGMIYTQTFDLKDSSTDDTAQLQYMLSYDFNPRLQIYASPIIDINYDARGGQKLDLPVGVGIKTTFFAGKIPMRLGLSYETYVENQDKLGRRDNTIKLLWTPVIPNITK